MTAPVKTSREELLELLVARSQELNTLNPIKRLRLGTTRKLVEFPRILESSGERLEQGVFWPTRLKRIGQTAFSYTPRGELVVSKRALDGSAHSTSVSVYSISPWEVAYLLAAL
ncbi:hypothetical protein GII36_01925 [Candidatus Mycosynbacter amalyticus]|uniref:Uncharacterized protein n=1 Tax=Candidatus Mycosynbacter amalyticus TaxID=2665156 RepID=A0A857MT45_9BACT|nr:hypothetical protein [Candidatus Mycosynbacter amalyticus]QHN42607.1 hypothetical protein GII36_01925 [Candidatus Mycosynbacter amalyticus]